MEEIEKWMKQELFEYLQKALIISHTESIDDYEKEELIKLVKEDMGL
jgi:hypothetical protein